MRPMHVQHIRYEAGVLFLLDQRQLPQTVTVRELRDWRSVGQAIENMVVRGAPAIGITAAYGMALAARAYAWQPDFLVRMMHTAAGLVKTRPTAVNLAWAVNRMMDRIRRGIAAHESPESIVTAVEQTAAAIHADDVSACRRIGDLGAPLLAEQSSVMTLCNTGSLATGGYGTALGIVRSAWRDGRLRQVFVCETRPLLQGARLTAWELAQDGIPYVLITDSTAGDLMRRGEVQAVVAGADRIARNGDVANKIGTYGLSVLARAHELPFIIAAPTSTFDLQQASGAEIPLEQRAASEVTEFHGVAVAPEHAVAANPSFDVTPAAHIAAIVTERGILRPPFDDAIAALLREPEALR
jgi:methylthioribose-1-phosphate isomerase